MVLAVLFAGSGVVLAQGKSMTAAVKPPSPWRGVSICPFGMRPATPPLNPVLGCVPVPAFIPPPVPTSVPPERLCPPGWEPAVPPLNPMLVCLPVDIVFELPDGGLPGPKPGPCPPGWRPVTSPVNPVLVCLPDVIMRLPGDGVLPPGECPDGWRPVTPPLNPVLGCLPDTIVLGPARPGRAGMRGD